MQARTTLDMPVDRGAASSHPQRVAWVDFCKGIGICLVVLGHSPINATAGCIIYTFHMPLFFFISGYLHKVTPNISAYFKKKTIHLLLPYMSFLLLSCPVIVASLVRHHAGVRGFEAEGINILWGGSRLRGLLGVFWFIPCLFAVQQVMNWVFAKWSAAAAAIFVLAALVLSYLNFALLPGKNLPLDLNVVGAALPFFYLGYLAAKVDLSRWWIDLLACAGAGMAAYLAVLQFPVRYNMRDGLYGMPGVSLVLALCCILLVVRLSRTLCQIKPVQDLFDALGLASMGIMFIHKELPAIPPLGSFMSKHPYPGALVALVISYGLTWMLAQSRYGRAFFLGSDKDLRTII